MAGRQRRSCYRQCRASTVHRSPLLTIACHLPRVIRLFRQRPNVLLAVGHVLRWQRPRIDAAISAVIADPRVVDDSHVMHVYVRDHRPVDPGD